MSHCDGGNGKSKEQMRDVLRDWLTHPDVQHHLHPNRIKLISNGIRVTIRD